MYDNEINKLNDITKQIKRINNKLLLLSLLNKAKKEYDENNYENCEDTCKEVLKTDPTNHVALRGLGCVNQIKGDYSSALKYYKLALKTSHNKEIENTLIGTIYYLNDKFDKAIKYFNLAIEINEDYDFAYEKRNQSILEKHLEISDLQESLIKKNMF